MRYHASNVALRDLCARATSEADGAESRFVRGSQEPGVDWLRATDCYPARPLVLHFAEA